MNAQKFTQKSLEAIQAAQDLTIENQNMQMEEVHLLIALLEQDQGLIPQLLLKMELPAQDIAKACNATFVGGFILNDTKKEIK